MFARILVNSKWIWAYYTVLVQYGMICYTFYNTPDLASGLTLVVQLCKERRKRYHTINQYCKKIVQNV